MGGLDKRLEALAHRIRGPKPVRINVVQEGPPGREREEEPLYSFVLQPSEDEDERGGDANGP